MSARIIALLTDFGQRDPFVGTMKGVMLGINPDLRFIDISHETAPQKIREAALTLSVTFPYFPPQTIFLVIVDPGVGGTRRPLVVETTDHLFVGPDNGVLGPVLSRVEVRRVIHATEAAYFLPSVSRTFHGRDVFAPLAAWVSCGTPLSDIGTEIHDYVRLELPRPHITDEQTIEGEVIHVDRFGNLMTNISEARLIELWGPRNWRQVRAQVGSVVIDGMDSYYAQRAPGTLGVLINSWGFCEIFVNGGNAAQETGAVEGIRVRLRRVSTTSEGASLA
jgi:S-adenosylmethionine hydrolase